VDDKESSNQLSVTSNQFMDYGAFCKSLDTDYGFRITDSFINLQERNRIGYFDFSNPNRVDLTVDVKVPAMLVMTDVWHPAWKALDNGEAIRIHRVNYLQRGIRLGEGEHKIEMAFHPPAVYSGRWIFLAGVILAAGFLIAEKIIKKRK